MSGHGRPEVPYVLKVLDVVGLVLNPEAGAMPGQYVRAYDPDAFGGRGDIVTTTDLDLALVLPSFGEAWAFWQTESTVAPLRPDGKPNRPLTAFTVELARLDDERRLLAVRR